MLHKLPNDPELENIDPVLKLYMYEHFIEDLQEKNEFAKHYGILIGSFSNPEMAQQMLGKSGKQFKISEAEFERLSEKIMEMEKQDDLKSKQHRRKRKLIR